MNLFQVLEKFPTQKSCIRYLERLRWGNSRVCPYCNSKEYVKTLEDFRYNCRSCNNTYSVTVKTIFHDTKIPLQKWFVAISLMIGAKKGISAKQLERNLDVTYKTAWSMAMRIRQAMTEDSILLNGIVEMDETFIGGKPRKFNSGETIPNFKRTSIPKLDERIKELKENGVELKRGKGNFAKSSVKPKRGRGTNKIPVVGMVQRNGNVIAEVMKTLTYQNLKEMVNKYVDEDNTVLITDEYKGYNRMSQIIEHIKIDHQKLYSYKGVNTNSIESFWAIVKLGIIGQYHKVSLKYLPLYINEFVYKYNIRNSDNDEVFKSTMKKASKHGD